MIERNKAITGRTSTVLFGLAELADALIRILSLGFLHSQFPLTVSRWQAKRYFEKLKAKK